MNPLLLKPQSDSASEVVVRGQVDHDLTRSRWRGRSKRLWPDVLDSYQSLRGEFDVIVLGRRR
jgi:adenosylcobyric acid synthase